MLMLASSLALVHGGRASAASPAAASPSADPASRRAAIDAPGEPFCGPLCATESSGAANARPRGAAANLSSLLPSLVDTSDFPPRWRCGHWTPAHGWLHIVADLTTWLSYVAIPCILVYFIWRRRDVPFPGVFLLFGAFIIACGATHLFEAIMFWWPAYRLMGVVKAFTAVISVATVIALIPIVPRALALRSPIELERMNARLMAEIARREKIERALRESEARFQRAVEGSCSGLWEWDIRTDRVWYAPRFKDLLGYGGDGAFGSDFASFKDRLHPEDRDRVCAAIQGHVAGKQPYDVEHRLLTQSGEYRWFQARGICFRNSWGQPTKMSGTIQDIHDRILAESTIRQRDAQLRDSQKLQAVGQLAGGVAHEFNNLLQIIGGYCGFVLKDLPADSKPADYINKVQTAVERGAGLTRQLLTFSRKEGLARETINANETVSDFCHMLKAVVGGHIKIETHLQDHVPPIQGEPCAIHQLLLNLSLNARDAMPDGGVLRLETAGVNISSSDNGEFVDAKPGSYVRFRVVDSGCGMDQQTCSRACEPFFTTKEVGQGMGLGLAQAYGVIQQHDGAMRLTSEPGQGTKVEFIIPASHERIPDNATAPQTSAVSGNELILIADDEPLIRDVAVMLLEDTGYRTITAHDGHSAVERFREHADSIDLLLFDVAMPGLSGHEAYRKIEEIASNIPVVFCTGYDEHGADHGADRVPGSRVVRKPYRTHELVRAVREEIDRRRVKVSAS